jgi:hypothetical protein
MPAGRQKFENVFPIDGVVLMIEMAEDYSGRPVLVRDHGHDIESRLRVIRSGARFREDPGGTGNGALILDPVAMQIVAVGVEPALGAINMAADFRDHPPEPRRMVHLDQMRDFMGGEIIQHERRRQDQPP